MGWRMIAEKKKHVLGEVIRDKKGEYYTIRTSCGKKIPLKQMLLVNDVQVDDE